MIQLTSRAANQVRSMQKEASSTGSLRLFVEDGGCSGMQYGMSFDNAKPEDEAFQSEGVSIVIDPKSLSHLQGTTVDFDDGLQGRGFEIKNPNAKSTCGCGKSFN
ncbi:MAG TPA: iron-sulfur cluster assembly accessory protein [Opitutaceae bacterium]